MLEVRYAYHPRTSRISGSKLYCNNCHIHIIGQLSFYSSEPISRLFAFRSSVALSRRAYDNPSSNIVSGGFCNGLTAASSGRNAPLAMLCLPARSFWLLVDAAVLPGTSTAASKA